MKIARPVALLLACSVAVHGASRAAPSCPADSAGAIDSIGDKRLQPLMDAWLAAFQRTHPCIARGKQWRHGSDATVFPALMFETADIAPLARAPLASELAPYAHQFAGDMMKAPLLVRVAGSVDQPAYIAVNKRPGSPLPARVAALIAFMLGSEGQQLVARDGRYAPLDADGVAAGLAQLDGYLAPLDAALPSYRAGAPVNGYIRSVGSDGMKTLMDRWMRGLRAAQPGIRKGERWEHLGTLNGFHALVANETDLAPMGRELWPAEQAAYASVHGGAAPLEIRVARGGFNTPQRTTAQVVFVHPSNPLAALSVPQLRAMLAGTGAGTAAPLTRWGQLGLTGEWAQRPIAVYTPPPAAPNTMSMQMTVLDNAPWVAGAHAGSIAATAAAIAADPGAIGFGGLEEGGPGLKTVAISPDDHAPAIAADHASAASGRYPLTRYMVIRLQRTPGVPLAAPLREFLRYVLSREGQEPVRYSGYFPLSAQEAQRELDKLR